LEHRLDGGGHELRSFSVDDDVPAEQHATGDPPGVPGASCGSAAMSALLVEVVVHRGAVHADGLGGLGDGVLPLAVRPDGFMYAALRGVPAVTMISSSGAGWPAWGRAAARLRERASGNRCD